MQRGTNLDDGAGLAGEVSADAPGKRVLSGRCVLAGSETGPFRRRCEGPCTETSGSPCSERSSGQYGNWNRGKKTEIPG